VAVPKAEELVATPYRHGGKQAAENFFLDGMTAALHNLARQAHPAFPVTIYYAFKQSDTKDDGGTHSTGWETFLEAVLARRLCAHRHLAHAHRAGCALDWHRHQRAGLQHRAGVPPARCGGRSHQPARVSAPVARAPARGAADHDRRQHRPEPIAPVDLAQAAIGPGMALYSQYPAVLNQDGTPCACTTR
jgi:putative DNA methylase